MTVRVTLFGLGSLGLEIARAVHGRKRMKLVGAVDIDAGKIGMDVGMLAANKKIGVRIGGHGEALKKSDIVLVATTSHLRELYDQIVPVIKKGTSVISTCEELVYPYTSGANAALASKLDALARKHSARILGVGVNPGFVMDLQVIALTGLCSRIDRIRVERVVDVARRRKALREKMCLGMTMQEFEAVKKGAGHVGLLESAAMICDALHVKASFTSTVRPIPASRMIKSYDVTVEPGRIAGLEHRLVGKAGNAKFIEMILYMFAGASEFDLIEIEGIPPVSVKTNGIQGDQATVSLLLNYIPILLAARPGLHTVKDLPVPALV